MQKVQRTLIFVEKSMHIFTKVRSTVTINERYFGATHLLKHCLAVSTNIKVRCIRA
jgi:hypothetical protein